MADASERLWQNVRKSDGCWEWISRVRNSHGYGRMYAYGRYQLAHRVSWQLHFGAIPEGLCVLHHCDNRLCVRPDHLFLGTVADNNQDMREKDRQARGVKHGSATHPECVPKGDRHYRTRLSDTQVKQVRELYATGTRQCDIARRFGVSSQLISDVVLGKRRKLQPT